MTWGWIFFFLKKRTRNNMDFWKKKFFSLTLSLPNSSYDLLGHLKLNRDAWGLNHKWHVICLLQTTGPPNLKYPLLLPSPNQLLCDCPHISTPRIVKERLIVHIWNKAAAFFIWGSLSFSLISVFSFKVCVLFLFCNYSLILFWIFWRLMEDDVSNPFRRMSMRTRKIAPKMAAALASNDNRTQVSVFLLKRLKKKLFCNCLIN
jgi:hypothetical protein